MNTPCFFGESAVVTVRQILKWLDEIAPFDCAESWDNVGLQVGDPAADVSTVLIALDLTPQVIKEAKSLGASCIITHHPLIFKPLSSLKYSEYPASLVCELIKSNISLIVAHTNLDASREGTNVVLAEVLGLSAYVPIEVNPSCIDKPGYMGLGVSGELPEEVSITELCKKLTTIVPPEQISVVGDKKRRIKRIAICTGSGGALIPQAIVMGAQCFISGEIKYHDAQHALFSGLDLITIGHFGSEKPVVKKIAALLQEKAQANNARVQFLPARLEADIYEKQWLEEDEL